MKDQLKQLETAMKGCRLVRAVPAGADGVMDLSFQILNEKAIGMADVRAAVESCGLRHSSTCYFRAMPRDAIIVRGVRPAEDSKDAAAETAETPAAETAPATKGGRR